jgi:hypothetical protein
MIPKGRTVKPVYSHKISQKYKSFDLQLGQTGIKKVLLELSGRSPTRFGAISLTGQRILLYGHLIILFADRICQKLFYQALCKIPVEICLDEKYLGRLSHLYHVDAQLFNILQNALSMHVGKIRPIENLDPPLPSRY